MRKDNEKGSVVIEATIALTSFMFLIVMILSILNICIVQARVGNAINITAREISQYSYLYGVTGINDSRKNIHDSAEETRSDIDELSGNINEVYSEISQLVDNGNSIKNDVSGSSGKFEDIINNIKNVGTAGKEAQSQLAAMAENPQQLIFGLARIAVDEGLDYATSRLVAAPLSKTLCKKNLRNEKGKDPDIYLKHLGVVPSGTGSYIDGLDFSDSTLFRKGSNEIAVDVQYDVKVVPLLPIDFKFHFHQRAVTQGWLGGERTYKDSSDFESSFNDNIEEENKEDENKEDRPVNHSMWTDAPVEERAAFIRRQGMKELEQEGYNKVSGLDGTYLYNKEKNEFVRIASTNPLYSNPGEPKKTVESLDDAALVKYIEKLCNKMKNNTKNMKQVNTIVKSDGQKNIIENNCAGASNKLILVIPQDKGLREKMEKAIAEAKKNGVEVELVSSYGNGAN